MPLTGMDTSDTHLPFASRPIKSRRSGRVDDEYG